MKYYLIYLKSGIVVDICSYDDEQTRDTMYRSWVYRDQNICNDSEFDQLQCLNVVL
jgi:hypothetical protein